MNTQPTAVLVHGAFADASGFAGVIRRLQAQGVPVRAPMNPLRGLASDAEAIRRYTSTIEGPIVLVGHSYGGAVISQAAPTIKDVRALVFLAAFALDQGETCVSVAEPFPPGSLATANVASPYDAPGAAGGPDLFIKCGQLFEFIREPSLRGPANALNLVWRTPPTSPRAVTTAPPPLRAAVAANIRAAVPA